MMRFLISLLVLVTTQISAAWAGDWQTGQFTVSDWVGPALRVFYVEPPEGRLPDAPVVIVMHGVNRNADEYRDNWIGLAEQYGLRIYAPEFTSADFPGAAFYNLGGVGTDAPSSYAAIEPLFAAIRARGSTASGYTLFGHSAGAQFVHRAVLFEDMPHLIKAYSANAGWYTLPDQNTDWPYGLAGVSVTESQLAAWLQRPMTLLLGEADTDRRDRNLRRTPEALAQGPHRFARGMFFFEAARSEADRLQLPIGWRVVTVPGVAHDNAGMAHAAAYLIAEDARDE
ncbi:alpha/beta hydrolase [Oceanicaulis sp. LC35]|uniref:alpha/beta hydrolase n=1 Tax=Oceanicaulis sp. LC35 TaxID=3349635 RepID=UPI003F84FDE3